MLLIKTFAVLILGFALYFPMYDACAQSGQWYVTPTGSDLNDCSSASLACATLSHAATVAQTPGTINLSAGNFYETQPSNLKPGVSIIGAGRDVTFLRSTDAFPPSIGLIRTYGSAINQTISNLTIDGLRGSVRSLYMGLDAYNTNGITVQDVAINNCTYTGAAFASSSGYINNITVTDSVFNNDAQSASLPNNWAYGNIMFWGVNNAVIARNVIDTTGGGGFGIKGANITNVKVFGNTITTPIKNPINGAPDAGIELQNISVGEIFNNTSSGWISVPNANSLNVHHKSPAQDMQSLFLTRAM